MSTVFPTGILLAIHDIPVFQVIILAFSREFNHRFPEDVAAAASPCAYDLSDMIDDDAGRPGVFRVLSESRLPPGSDAHVQDNPAHY